MALAARLTGYLGRGNAAQAQGLRPFAMWLAPHIHPKKSEPENLQAVFRPYLFRSAPGVTPRRLKTCGLSLCGCRHIFIPKSTGRRIRKRLPGLAFSIRAGGNAAQAQDLRSFAMWLSPHIHPKKSGPENLQAVFRPCLFRMTARLVEKIKNPLTTGRRSDNVCVRRC